MYMHIYIFWISVVQELKKIFHLKIIAYLLAI